MAGIVSFVEALSIVQAHARKLPSRDTERVPLLHSLGRVLAWSIAADRDQPPFDRSTRDGFAVHTAEWNSGQKLRVAGQIRAGDLWTGDALAPGTAIEIMTGAPIPPEADGVAMLEHAIISDSSVSAREGRSLAPSENIVPCGSEAHAGDNLVHAGTVIGAGEIAVAATCGLGEVSVHTQPHIAIAATGDELVGLNDHPGPHQIRNSNSFALAALVQLAGGIPHVLEVARDVRQDVSDRITAGRTSDLLLLSGGVSAGKYDLVEDVLAEFGAEFLFTGVTMQPGKPVVFGRLPPATSGGRDTYFFGLPGNPVSTQVTFHCFVEPLLRVRTGGAWTGPRFAQARLSEAVAPKSGLTRVLPARVTPGVEDTTVHLVRWQGSGDLAANARANCYAVIPDGKAQVPGDVITILLR